MGRLIWVIFILISYHDAYSKTKLCKLTGQSQKILWVSPETQDAQLSWHQGCQKVPLVTLTTERFRSPSESTGDIIKTIRDSERPISLICEKKAAADCLAALLIYPEIQKKVDIFVSLHGYIQGDPKARNSQPPRQLETQQANIMQNFLVAIHFAQETWDWIFKGHAWIYPLSPHYRKKYLSRNRAQIKELSQNVQLISIRQNASDWGLVPFSQSYLWLQPYLDEPLAHK